MGPPLPRKNYQNTPKDCIKWIKVIREHSKVQKMVVKTKSISKPPSDSYHPGIDISSNNWQRIKISPSSRHSSPKKSKESSAMSRQGSAPERPETATLEKPSILDPNLSKKIDMTILSRENLKYVDNLVVKPIPKKASIEEQTLAFNSLSAGFNTISGPNSLNLSAESNRSGLKGELISKSSSFNPVTLEGLKNPDHRSNTNAKPISPGFLRQCKGKAVLSESKPNIQALNKNNRDETPSKLSKLYKAINKSYRIRASFRRNTKDVKDNKSNSSRSSSRNEISNKDEAIDASLKNQSESKAEREKVAHSGGKLKKAVKKAVYKEKKHELVTAQKSAVRKPFAVKYKARSRSLRRSDETGKTGKKTTKEEKKTKETENHAVRNLKVPGDKLETGNGGGSSAGTGTGSEKKMLSSPSPSSHIPVRKTGSGLGITAVLSSGGPSSLTAEDLRPITRDFENGYSLTEWIPVPPSSGRRPRLIKCRFCRREFGTASYPVHEPRCMRLWLGEQSKTKENKLGSHTSINQAEDHDPVLHNTKESTRGRSGSQSDKGTKNLAPTRGKMDTSRLGTGKKAQSASATPTETPVPISTPTHGGVPASSTIPEETQSMPPLVSASVTGSTSGPSTSAGTISMGRRPPTVSCHICNREFGSKSISIHEPQCLYKHRLEQDKRIRKKPGTTADKENKLTQEPLSDDTFWESHRQQLVPCKKCARTFNPDRVVIHERSCKGRKPKKK